ncbi:hypothetical protein FJZ53_01510 [Candidatus Woesearchaeota archaeon]|nr:hypothetical protein [Candidatus Woesearchaeota archaeon]
MKKGFLREKAILQIVLIIVAMIYFGYAIKPVSAGTQQCCEKTAKGDYCFYGDSSNCDPAFKYAATRCEQTDYCKLGCCYDMNEGTCYKSVPQSKCLGVQDAEWYTDATCDTVSACSLGCCTIGSQCKLTTQQSCALETAKHPDLEMVYDSSISSEMKCLDVCRASEKGCCVNTDGGCIYETRAACDAGQGAFNTGQYCSAIATCGCKAQESKTCFDEDVYWQDSCGNLEDVAEDCDYAQGTLCKNMKGEFKCGTVNCEMTYKDEKNVHDPEMGGFRKNGESWCLYESGTGDYIDRPGTRHYRHMCVNGQEVVESCRDYREEICSQAEVEGMTSSQCLHNDIYESPIKEQISTVPRGFRFWEEKGDCDDATNDCTVVWVKKNRMSDWKCEQNCHCETQQYIDDMAKACKSKGDCGANLNIVGERTTDGFVLSGRGRRGPPSGKPSEAAWAEWSKYGVFGGMVDLLEKLLKALQDLGVEKPEGLWGMGGMGEALIGGVVAAVSMLVIMNTLGVGAAIGGVVSQSAFLGSITSFFGATAATIIGVVVVIVVIIIMFVIFGGGKVKEYHVITECKPWQAPTGGKNCKYCLDQKKVDELKFYDACTEYKCKSLGQNCGFIEENSGTDRVACYDANPNDVNSPIISPWPEALTEGFTVNEMDQGYEIKPEAPYFEKIEFGIKTNELSQCKVSPEHTEKYDEMNSYFGDSFYQMEHNMTVNPLIGGKTFDYYVRCRDGNGNSNTAEYVIRLTTTKEPDKTPPKIEATAIDDYGFVPYNATETGFAIYLNEPANCKWSFTDLKYNDMENVFYCQDEPTNALNYETYPCYTILNITAKGTNTYYFRCEDTSEFKNQNQQGYEFHLVNTEELKIVSKSPGGTLYNISEATLSVITQGGAEDGNAKCYYSDDPSRDFTLWPEFYETGTTIHSQPLIGLDKGDVFYNVKCLDKASNEASATITFKLDQDLKPPELDFIYVDSVALHIVLNEPANCEYSNSTFAYGTGDKMSGGGTNHNTVSSSDATYYYVNCADIYNNDWNDPIKVYL